MTESKRKTEFGMAEMTTRERINRMFVHGEADRVPIVETPWPTTKQRWQKEGMGDQSPEDFFELDHVERIGVDNSPRFSERVVEETDEYIIKTTKWGVTKKNWKQKGSTPEFLDNYVKTPEDWLEAKQRMTFDEDRIPWEQLAKNWEEWQNKGAYIEAGGWFGFDVTHAQFVGTERTLFALAENPEWVVDMWQTQQDLNLQLLDRIWEEGYHFDALRWPDDMGYKYTQFFSMEMYRDLLKPIHRKAIQWAHAKGIPAILHSCGDVRPFIPELVEMGLDGLNPLEVKAGVDPLQVKRDHGDRLLLHGGFNALSWRDVETMKDEIRQNLPTLKESGGYMFATDHSTPEDVSLEEFREVIKLVKAYGRF